MAGSARQDLRGRVGHWSAENAAFLAVLVLPLAGFVYLLLAPGHWVRSSAMIALGMLIAALLRAVLPTDRVGLLAVRSKVLDIATYVVLGGVILGVDIRLHG